jgi:hypothetical protein
MEKPINEMSKDELKAYAESGVDFEIVNIDMRKNVDELRTKIQDAYDLAHPTPVIGGELFTKNETVPFLATHIKNKANNRIFPKTDLLVKYLGDNGVVCDKDGNPA